MGPTARPSVTQEEDEEADDPRSSIVLVAPVTGVGLLSPRARDPLGHTRPMRERAARAGA